MSNGCAEQVLHHPAHTKLGLWSMEVNVLLLIWEFWGEMLQKWQRIFETELIGMYTLLTVVPFLIWYTLIRIWFNRAKSSGHFVGLSTFHLILIYNCWVGYVICCLNYYDTNWYVHLPKMFRFCSNLQCVRKLMFCIFSVLVIHLVFLWDYTYNSGNLS